jgi:hypothetical protein
MEGFGKERFLVRNLHDFASIHHGNTISHVVDNTQVV